MAGSLNKVMLIGNVGRDPEIRSTQDGREIAQIALATSESWRDKSTGEKREKTEWHRVVVFSEGLVNVVKNYVKKGSKLFVEGSLQTRKWTDNNGQERYNTEIVLQGYNGSLTMLDARGGENSQFDNNSHMSGSSSSSLAEEGESFLSQDLDDDIPF